MSTQKNDDGPRVPYTLTIKCKGCGSEYEIRCTVDRGGMQGPKHCCYCSKVFQEPWEPPHDPFDQTPR